MKVRFLTPVQHDRNLHAVGETADLPSAAAQALVKGGAAEPVDAAADKAAARADAHAQANAQAAALAKAERWLRLRPRRLQRQPLPALCRLPAATRHPCSKPWP